MQIASVVLYLVVVDTNITETKAFVDFLQQRDNRKNRQFWLFLFTFTINTVIVQDTSVAAQTKQVS